MSQVQETNISQPVEMARRRPEVVLFATLFVVIAAVSLALILIPVSTTPSPEPPNVFEALREHSLREYGTSAGGLSAAGTAQALQEQLAREYGLAPVVADPAASTNAQQLFQHTLRENMAIGTQVIAPVIAQQLFEHVLRENGQR